MSKEIKYGGINFPETTPLNLVVALSKVAHSTRGAGISKDTPKVRVIYVDQDNNVELPSYQIGSGHLVYDERGNLCMQHSEGCRSYVHVYRIARLLRDTGDNQIPELLYRHPNTACPSYVWEPEDEDRPHQVKCKQGVFGRFETKEQALAFAAYCNGRRFEMPPKETEAHFVQIREGFIKVSGTGVDADTRILEELERYQQGLPHAIEWTEVTMERK